MNDLRQLVVSLAARLGINRAVFFALATRFWQLLAGPVTALLLALHFSPQQQGFYYTFGSILGLQIFFELGLSFVITQFSAHEFSKLRWGRSGALVGDERAVQNFLDFLSNAVKWYLFAAAGLVIFVLPAGFVFFSRHTDVITADLVWYTPWYAAVISTSLNLVTVPLLAAIEGSGNVAVVYKLRFAQAICASVLTWIALIAGAGLYSVAVNAIANALIGSIWLLRTHRELIGLVASRMSKKRCAAQSQFSWKLEVWPVQWRIAVSWISGYFIAQIFVPILFHYQGPVVAGQMGMTMSIAGMLTMASMAWITTSLPDMGRLAAAGRWPKLDQVFKRAFTQSLTIFAIGYALIIGFLWIFSDHELAKRLLPISETAILLASGLVSHIIGSLATYLRAHKREPFAPLSVIGAVLMVTTILPLGKMYSSYGIVVGSLMINLLYGLPSAIWLWKRLRISWHNS